MNALTYADVEAASERIAGLVRHVVVARADPGEVEAAGAEGQCEVYFALEFMQHTGTFKARGAQNFIEAHRAAGTLPEAGVTIASGGNAGLACAWAARDQGIPATVFLPASAPRVKIERLSHRQIPGLDAVVVAVGGGGLFAGVATAAQHYGIRTIAVEPGNCRALNAALEAGLPVDVAVDSVAADSLGARRVSRMALRAAQHDMSRSVLVPDSGIVRARQSLWDNHRLAVEYGAGTALAGLLSPGGYRPADGEKVCVVLCGANTDPSDLVQGPA